MHTCASSYASMESNPGLCEIPQSVEMASHKYLRLPRTQTLSLSPLLSQSFRKDGSPLTQEFSSSNIPILPFLIEKEVGPLPCPMSKVVRLGHAGYFRCPGGFAYFDGELTFRCVWRNDAELVYEPAPDLLHTQVFLDFPAAANYAPAESAHSPSALVEYEDGIHRRESRRILYEEHETTPVTSADATGSPSSDFVKAEILSPCGTSPHMFYCRYEPLPGFPLAPRKPSFAHLLHFCFLPESSYGMNLKDIYDWVLRHCRTATPEDRGWENSVRHNLSLNIVSNCSKEYMKDSQY